MIPADELPRLFQPFQRRDRDGYGLGLAIVDAAARAHHANVTARARREGGLSIEVAWPRGYPAAQMT